MGLVRLQDGRRLHTWEGGSPSGRPVLFLHGCPDCRRAAVTGSSAASQLGIRLVSFSRPGYGLSDACESDHLTVADDIVSLADALGIDRFGLIGMSVGGPYALACATRHPSRVSAVAVVAAPAPLRVVADTVAEGIEHFRPGFSEYVAGVDLDGTDSALAAQALSALDPRDAVLLSSMPPAQLAALMRESLSRPDGYLRDAAVTFTPWTFDPSAVLCPVELFYGALDSNASPDNGHWYASRLSHARLTVLDDTTHLATLLNNWYRILSAWS